jgi:DNA-binding response OmpR family regulator
LQVATSSESRFSPTAELAAISQLFSKRQSAIGVRRMARFMRSLEPDRKSRPAENEGSSPMAQSQVHILVVDDERNIRNNLCMVLEAEGYTVETASNGDDALLRVKEGGRYDIAFVDIQMPKMGGLELLGYLRGLRPKLAVVMLTAYGTVARAVEAMKLGAVDFLEKPFDPKAVPLLCEEILQRQKIGKSGTLDELLHLAEAARGRKAFAEARIYLKIAMQRDVARPEPYYLLGELSEDEGRVPHAVNYYYMALDAQSTFQPARDALTRLGRLDVPKDA